MAPCGRFQNNEKVWIPKRCCHHHTCSNPGKKGLQYVKVPDNHTKRSALVKVLLEVILNTLKFYVMNDDLAEIEAILC